MYLLAFLRSKWVKKVGMQTPGPPQRDPGRNSTSDPVFQVQNGGMAIHLVTKRCDLESLGVPGPGPAHPSWARARCPSPPGTPPDKMGPSHPGTPMAGAYYAIQSTHTLRCTARYLIFCRNSRPVLPRRQVPSPDVAPRQGLHERTAPLVSTTRRIWGARVRACRSHRPQCLSRLSSRRRCNREACTWVSISWRLFPDQPRGGGVEEDEAAAVHLAQLCIWTC